jgi:predicted unusual protein kinase regulating ubiquinone biosynthesis (AarF/ABC1/UbiB family)
VHAAQLKSGERLAIKVQYPGVGRSISSDVDNVATLLRVSGLLPPASTSRRCSTRPSASCTTRPTT